jgi:nucleotide-binding universal stress UspA family protein
VPIKLILVPMDGSDDSARVLATAKVVAERFDAHIKAIHVVPRAEKPFLFDRIPPGVKKMVAEETEKAVRQRVDMVRKQFEEHCQEYGLAVVDGPAAGNGTSASLFVENGNPADVLVAHGRLSDVVTIARPAPREGRVRRSPLGETVEAILLYTGRPVLIVPPDWVPRRVERAAVGWNESLEASRALSATIPWLRQMTSITVISSRKRAASTDRLLEYLSLHGCSADVQLLDGRRSSVGEAMLDFCKAGNVEFLVVGGFSRARSRQLLFGGVTQHLLNHSNLITAMVH